MYIYQFIWKCYTAKLLSNISCYPEVLLGILEKKMTGSLDSGRMYEQEKYIFEDLARFKSMVYHKTLGIRCAGKIFSSGAHMTWHFLLTYYSYILYLGFVLRVRYNEIMQSKMNPEIYNILPRIPVFTGQECFSN